MNHLNLEVVGLDEGRAVEHVRDEAGNIIDAVPGKEEHWLVVAVRPSGETIRAQVSDEDWKRLLAPLLDAERGGRTLRECVRFE
jgi:hypothetical protein